MLHTRNFALRGQEGPGRQDPLPERGSKEIQPLLPPPSQRVWLDVGRGGEVGPRQSPWHLNQPLQVIQSLHSDTYCALGVGRAR